MLALINEKTIFNRFDIIFNITTYKSNNILSTGDYFKIREISIENNFILNNKDLLEDFPFLIKKIFFVK